MKWSRRCNLRILITGAIATMATCVCVAAIRPLWHGTPLLFSPGHGIARWIENVRAGSDIEKALYRAMQLPGGEVLFRRAPRETVPALTSLQQAQKTAALYTLRAIEEEQALDFTSAERDWKAWADQAEDRSGAYLDLADFYERRLQPVPEIAALELVGNSAPDPRERWTATERQRSWKAFERALRVADEYALTRGEKVRLYAAWAKRYSQAPAVYEQQFAFLLDGKDWPAASSVISQYRAAFPADRVFPVKAEADLASRRGQVKDGLAIYEARFEPLWPAELVKSYLGMVIASHNQRAFSDAIRAKLAAKPDDLTNAARLFYLYQQQGQIDSAKAVFAHYREQKEARGARWTAEELYTLESLYEGIQDFPEAARYAYALAADKSAPDSERKGVVALTRILLTAPEQPLRVGAGNLALYKNIATMDRGPGYLNGILSLWLNTQGPSFEYANEDRMALPYFHRARAAELLAQIDQRFPDEPTRPQLHASLMEAYAVYGENPAVIREGTAILAQFPHFGNRVHVALELADAYERTNDTEKEFSVYQQLLKELSAEADGVPLGTTGDAYSKPINEEQKAAAKPAPPIGDSEEPADEASPHPAGVRSVQYNEVLNRYLARLVALHRTPDALNVLRGELDRNPQDPGLYDKLATFLDQNALNAHIEEIYQQAIQQFQDTGWYAKLARFYLRQRRNSDYSALMHKVADIFSGTELEEYLQNAPAPNRSLSIEVNLYAHQRFPHDLRFVDHLISQYGTIGKVREVETLLWEHWWESPRLRDQLFAVLSQTGRLDSELATLKQQAPEIDKADWSGLAERNPAAERFWLEACLWQSHFEQGVAAADALANTYPADAALGAQTSSLHRSFAYFHPEDTDKAVAVEKRLLESDPGNLDTLARIGDIYADRERFSESAPYWIRMAEVRPGEANGYLQSATVFWDYFDFASAQSQLEKGRERLNDPTLFGYQEGAIAESRGDLPAAVRAYTASTIAEKPSVASRERLLVLAHRPSLRAPVEDGTGALLKSAAPAASAIQLRAEILESEHRKEDLVRELSSMISRTESFDVLDAITSTARSHSLPEIEQAALRRQIALTADPVHNLQLRYQLVDLIGQRNPTDAAREVDAIFRENPKILGVVRATVDYDWDHDRKREAVSVLLDSAKLSYADLKSQFELEAARKLTDLGDYAKSRTVLTSLLDEKPLDAAYEGAMADNLARANDPSALATFYRSQIELIRKASLERNEKQQRIGQLRRGMIAAATLLGNPSDAIDQYIELINVYPDDSGLAQEAALYAIERHNRDRLFGFYQKTINDSSRDPRWSIVLARLATAAEDYPLAIDAYGRALKLRPERQDLYIAQASLDEKLHRLDDAIAVYRKLYTLSYRDPSWMEKVAELCARQGRAAEAVKALQTGWIEGRPAKATDSFTVAEKLERWGLLDDARKFAEQGVAQAGPELLVSEQTGAATYARILTRQRQTAAAFATLVSAREQAPKVSIAAVAQQVAKDGLSAVTNEEWRKQRENERRTQAAFGFAQALRAMASAVADFYTPEEKSEFATLLQQKSSGANDTELESIYLPAARSAGLADLSADLMWNIAVSRQQPDQLNLSGWIEFQKQRGRMSAAAAQLEKFASAALVKNRLMVWKQTSEAYRSAGDTVGELRAMEHVAASQHLEGEDLARFYRLLLAQRPAELIDRASASDSAVQYLVRNGNRDQALSAIRARAGKRSPVWRDAYTALTGLYLREYQPEINEAFSTALGTEQTIGDRVAHPADRNTRLAGEVWFYYGSRYGEYLDSAQDTHADDYLDAELEHTPANSDAYFRLANYSSEKKRADAALIDYQHSLDLKRDQPGVLDDMAMLQWNAGHHADALAAWNDAVKRLAEEMDSRHVPETFWNDFERVLGDTSARGQFEAVRQPVDAILRTYIARNGDYRVSPLLRAAYQANGRSADWLVAITAAANNQQGVLESIVPNSWSKQGDWIDKQQLSRIYQRIVELAERNSQMNPGPYDSGLGSARQRYVRALLEEKRYTEAHAVLSQIPAPQLNSSMWLPLVLSLAEKEGKLQEFLASWKKMPASAPAANDLRLASSGLGEEASRSVRRYIYEQAIENRDFSAANFLGLAEIDLAEGNTASAVQLLKRLTLVSNNIYADTDAAAHLLESRNKPGEALAFLQPLAQDSPWNSEYKVRLAKAMLGANPHQTEALNILKSVSADPKAKYEDRVSAAKALKGESVSITGSEELILLAQAACPTPEAVAKPLFVESRITAAACATTPKAKERLLGEALAINPADARLRLAYVWSAFAAGFDSRALVAAEQYLQPAYSYNPTYNAEGEEAAGGPISLASLKPDEAVKLIELAAAAYERKREYAEASRIVAQAMDIIRDSANREKLEAKQTRLSDTIARVQENDARAPNVHAALDQNRIVRGRLLPGMPLPAKPRLEVEQ